MGHGHRTAKGLFPASGRSAECGGRRKTPVFLSPQRGAATQKRACWGNSRSSSGYCSPMGIENRDGMVTARSTQLTSLSSQSRPEARMASAWRRPAAARAISAPSALMTGKSPSNFQRMPHYHPPADHIRSRAEAFTLPLPPIRKPRSAAPCFSFKLMHNLVELDRARSCSAFAQVLPLRTGAKGML